MPTNPLPSLPLTKIEFSVLPAILNFISPEDAPEDPEAFVLNNIEELPNVLIEKLF